MKGLMSIVIMCLLGCRCIAAEGCDTLSVSLTQTVHLRFASELKYVNLGNRSMVAKIIDGSKDIVAIKAREAFDYYTSVSCLELNGQMHTYVVRYDEYPSSLLIDTRGKERTGNETVSEIADISGQGKELYHLGCSGYDISLQCDNIFIKDDMLYISVSLKNGSQVSYEFADPRFSIESRKKTKRSLVYEKSVIPRSVYGLGPVAPDGEGHIVFGFDKISLVKGQVLRIFIYETRGSRNFMLTLGINDINKAHRL